MNDLAYVIKQSKLSAYTDDTQIFHANNNYAKVQETIDTDLRYAENGMKRNHSKYQAIIMGKTQCKPELICENTVIPIGEQLDLLEVTVDDKLKFDKHIAKYAGKYPNKLQC